jgi:hypothetical protein
VFEKRDLFQSRDRCRKLGSLPVIKRESIRGDDFSVYNVAVKDLLGFFFIEITVLYRRRSTRFDRDHRFSTAKSCATGTDELDILNSCFFHLSEDQGPKLLRSRSNSASPHMEIDLGSIPSLPKRKVGKGFFLDLL